MMLSHLKILADLDFDEIAQIRFTLKVLIWTSFLIFGTFFCAVLNFIDKLYLTNQIAYFSDDLIANFFVIVPFLIIVLFI